MAKLYTNDRRRPETLSQLLKRAAEPLWSHCAAYKLCIGNVEEAIKVLDNPKLSEINTVMIDDYISVIQDGRSPGTVNRKMSSVRAILKYAYDREWIERMPKFNWKKENEHRTRWLSAEEETKLLSILPEDVAAFVEVLIHTGMRRGELMTMKRDQLQGNYVRLWKTKSGKARSVPLTPRAKELLDKWLPFEVTEKRIRLEWIKAKDAMGLSEDKEFVLHTCRHTTATRLLESTGNLVMVQKLLGHSKITTTTRYAHIADEQLLEAIRRDAKCRYSEGSQGVELQSKSLDDHGDGAPEVATPKKPSNSKP